MKTSTTMSAGAVDDEGLLGNWGFVSNHCHNCKKPNSLAGGLLMQCAKCKLAYYCSTRCFNDHLPIHQLVCNTGALASQPKPAGTDFIAFGAPPAPRDLSNPKKAKSTAVSSPADGPGATAGTGLKTKKKKATGADLKKGKKKKKKKKKVSEGYGAAVESTDRNLGAAEVEGTDREYTGREATERDVGDLDDDPADEEHGREHVGRSRLGGRAAKTLAYEPVTEVQEEDGDHDDNKNNETGIIDEDNEEIEGVLEVHSDNDDSVAESGSAHELNYEEIDKDSLTEKTDSIVSDSTTARDIDRPSLSRRNPVWRETKPYYDSGEESRWGQHEGEHDRIPSRCNQCADADQPCLRCERNAGQDNVVVPSSRTAQPDRSESGTVDETDGKPNKTRNHSNMGMRPGRDWSHDSIPRRFECEKDETPCLQCETDWSKSAGAVGVEKTERARSRNNSGGFRSGRDWSNDDPLAKSQDPTATSDAAVDEANTTTTRKNYNLGMRPGRDWSHDSISRRIESAKGESPCLQGEKNCADSEAADVDETKRAKSRNNSSGFRSGRDWSSDDQWTKSQDPPTRSDADVTEDNKTRKSKNCNLGMRPGRDWSGDSILQCVERGKEELPCLSYEKNYADSMGDGVDESKRAKPRNNSGGFRSGRDWSNDDPLKKVDDPDGRVAEGGRAASRNNSGGFRSGRDWSNDDQSAKSQVPATSEGFRAEGKRADPRNSSGGFRSGRNWSNDDQLAISQEPPATSDAGVAEAEKAKSRNNSGGFRSGRDWSNDNQMTRSDDPDAGVVEGGKAKSRNNSGGFRSGRDWSNDIKSGKSQDPSTSVAGAGEGERAKSPKSSGGVRSGRYWSNDNQQTNSHNQQTNSQDPATTSDAVAGEGRGAKSRNNSSGLRSGRDWLNDDQLAKSHDPGLSEVVNEEPKTMIRSNNRGLRPGRDWASDSSRCVECEDEEQPCPCCERNSNADSGAAGTNNSGDFRSDRDWSWLAKSHDPAMSEVVNKEPKTMIRSNNRGLRPGRDWASDSSRCVECEDEGQPCPCCERNLADSGAAGTNNNSGDFRSDRDWSWLAKSHDPATSEAVKEDPQTKSRSNNRGLRPGRDWSSDIPRCVECENDEQPCPRCERNWADSGAAVTNESGASRSKRDWSWMAKSQDPASSEAVSSQRRKYTRHVPEWANPDSRFNRRLNGFGSTVVEDVIETAEDSNSDLRKITSDKRFRRRSWAPQPFRMDVSEASIYDDSRELALRNSVIEKKDYVPETPAWANPDSPPQQRRRSFLMELFDGQDDPLARRKEIPSMKPEWAVRNPLRKSMRLQLLVDSETSERRKSMTRSNSDGFRSERDWESDKIPRCFACVDAERPCSRCIKIWGSDKRPTEAKTSNCRKGSRSGRDWSNDIPRCIECKLSDLPCRRCQRNWDSDNDSNSSLSVEHLDSVEDVDIHKIGSQSGCDWFHDHSCSLNDVSVSGTINESGSSLGSSNRYRHTRGAEPNRRGPSTNRNRPRPIDLSEANACSQRCQVPMQETSSQPKKFHWPKQGWTDPDSLSHRLHSSESTLLRDASETAEDSSTSDRWKGVSDNTKFRRRSWVTDRAPQMDMSEANISDRNREQVDLQDSTQKSDVAWEKAESDSTPHAQPTDLMTVASDRKKISWKKPDWASNPPFRKSLRLKILVHREILVDPSAARELEKNIYGDNDKTITEEDLDALITKLQQLQFFDDKHALRGVSTRAALSSPEVLQWRDFSWKKPEWAQRNMLRPLGVRRALETQGSLRTLDNDEDEEPATDQRMSRRASMGSSGVERSWTAGWGGPEWAKPDWAQRNLLRRRKVGQAVETQETLRQLVVDKDDESTTH